MKQLRRQVEWPPLDRYTRTANEWPAWEEGAMRTDSTLAHGPSGAPVKRSGQVTEAEKE